MTGSESYLSPCHASLFAFNQIIQEGKDNQKLIKQTKYQIKVQDQILG